MAPTSSAALCDLQERMELQPPPFINSIVCVKFQFGLSAGVQGAGLFILMTNSLTIRPS